MTQIVNLRQIRKSAERAAKRAQADANAAKYGRTKTERDLQQSQSAKAHAHLDGHKRDT